MLTIILNTGLHATVEISDHCNKFGYLDRIFQFFAVGVQRPLPNYKSSAYLLKLPAEKKCPRPF